MAAFVWEQGHRREVPVGTSRGQLTSTKTAIAGHDPVKGPLAQISFGAQSQAEAHPQTATASVELHELGSFNVGTIRVGVLQQGPTIFVELGGLDLEHPHFKLTGNGHSRVSCPTQSGHEAVVDHWPGLLRLSMWEPTPMGALVAQATRSIGCEGIVAVAQQGEVILTVVLESNNVFSVPPGARVCLAPGPMPTTAAANVVSFFTC